MTGQKKIRVLHVITRLISGGADENTIYTVEGLNNDLYQVDVLVGAQSEEEQMSRIRKARILMEPHLVRQLYPVYDFIAFWKICRLLKARKYHILHTHTAKAGMVGRFAGKLCGIPIIVHTLHGSTFHENLNPLTNFVYRFLEKLAARFTQRVISVGNDLKDRYVKAGVGRPEQYITIRSGFDLGRFLLSGPEIDSARRHIRRELDIADSDIVVGSASRLEPRKGHVYFLQAASHIAKANKHVQFIIAGEGDAEAELRSFAKKVGLEKRVHFLGHRQDIECVMSAMDVFVLSSLWEGLPRVLVQSAALGKPIVTFDIEGARELVQDGRNGFVVPLKDIRTLIDRILYLVNNPAKAHEMGARGRENVSSEWNYDTMVYRIDQLYRTLLREKGVVDF